MSGKYVEWDAHGVAHAMGCILGTHLWSETPEREIHGVRRLGTLAHTEWDTHGMDT